MSSVPGSLLFIWEISQHRRGKKGGEESCQMNYKYGVMLTFVAGKMKTLQELRDKSIHDWKWTFLFFFFFSMNIIMIPGLQQQASHKGSEAHSAGRPQTVCCWLELECRNYKTILLSNIYFWIYSSVLRGLFLPVEEDLVRHFWTTGAELWWCLGIRWIFMFLLAKISRANWEH